MIKGLNINNSKLKDLKLREIQLAKDYDKMTGYPSLDKPWLKYYDVNAIVKDASNKTAYECIKDANDGRNNAIALKYFSKNITYNELFKNIDIVATALLDLGIREKSVVTLALPNILENVYCLYALNKIGAIANIIDYNLQAKDLVEAIEKVGSKTFIGTTSSVKNLDAVANATYVKDVIAIDQAEYLPIIYRTKNDKKPDIEMNYITWKDFITNGKKSLNYAYNYDTFTKDTSFCIFQTPATSLESKPVVLDNENFNSLVNQVKLSGFSFKRKDKFLSVLPSFTVDNIIMSIHLPLSLGMSVDLIPSYEPTKFMEIVTKHKPNHVIAKPSDWKSFLDNYHTRNNYSNLKTLITTGDKMSDKDKNKLNSLLSKNGCPGRIVEAYSTTESSSIATTNLPNLVIENSVGIPLPKVNVCIYDNNLNEEVPYEKRGEICLSGPTIMNGYYNRLDETLDALKLHDDGQLWLHTNDYGYMNEDGVLFCEGRGERLITTPNNKTISPYTIENIINQFDAVKDVSVVGIPDKENDNASTPVASIILDKNVKKSKVDTIVNNIKELCDNRLSESMRPTEYFLTEELPYTKNGKLDYLKLGYLTEKASKRKMLRR